MKDLSSIDVSGYFFLCAFLCGCGCTDWDYVKTSGTVLNIDEDNWMGEGDARVWSGVVTVLPNLTKGS